MKCTDIRRVCPERSVFIKIRNLEYKTSKITTFNIECNFKTLKLALAIDPNFT